MKTIVMMAAALMLSVTANATVNPGEGEKENANLETTTVTMTLAELKIIYGSENVDISALGEISDQTLISFTTTAGPPCNGEQQCGAALAQARHQSQLLANTCCCIQINGVECCSQGNLLAILFLVEPNPGLCP
ncbi:MAG: hypothetical protein ACI837_002256 [Crocinitomicaceae bacterium]|jgi:hypothetical protein